MSRVSGLQRLVDYGQKASRKVVGLRSGLSVEGIDAVLAQISGSGSKTTVQVLQVLALPFPAELKASIHEAFEGSVEVICELNFLLGEAFAEAAIEVVERAGLKMSEIDAIASAGQTVYHIDPCQRKIPSTLQIGEASVIAERTGRLVVTDFRTRDLAAGGVGASLIASVEYFLFSQPGRYLALQNIGGIASVIVVPPPGRGHEIIAFETGPGTLIIDEIARELRDDDHAIDYDGRFSALGTVDQELLEELLTHDFFAIEPPKSTGRELFGVNYCRDLVENYDPDKTVDLLATVVALTGRSIVGAYERSILPKHKLDEVIVSGGGQHNKTLMSHLTRLLNRHSIPVSRFDQDRFGFPGEAKKALAFAVIANETLLGYASSSPAATGASHSVIQGKIVL